MCDIDNEANEVKGIIDPTSHLVNLHQSHLSFSSNWIIGNENKSVMFLANFGIRTRNPQKKERGEINDTIKIVEEER